MPAYENEAKPIEFQANNQQWACMQTPARTVRPDQSTKHISALHVLHAELSLKLSQARLSMSPGPQKLEVPVLNVFGTGHFLDLTCYTIVFELIRFL